MFLVVYCFTPWAEVSLSERSDSPTVKGTVRHYKKITFQGSKRKHQKMKQALETFYVSDSLFSSQQPRKTSIQCKIKPLKG